MVYRNGRMPTAGLPNIRSPSGDLVIGQLPTKLDYLRLQVSSLGTVQALYFKLMRGVDRLRPRRSPYRLYSKRVAGPVFVRPRSSDLSVFHQIFIEREYRCLDDVTDVRFIIDCGANVGYSSLCFLSQHPDARLVAIEPERNNFAALARNLHRFSDRVELLQRGLWSHSTGLVIEEHDDAADGKDWAFTVREAEPGEAPDVTATDLTTIWKNAGCPTIDILKVDIEGSEAVVFAAEEKPWLDAVRNIVIELHGEQCTAEFEQAISGRGFVLSRSGELTVAKR
jgi:FkbM family methyltransferase